MEDKKLELMRYLRLVRSKLLHLIALAVVVALLTTLIVNLMPPVYQATTLLLLKPEHAKAVSMEDMFNLDKGTTTYFNTQRNIIQSRSMLEKVVNKLGLDQNPTTPMAKPRLIWLKSLFGLNSPLSQEEKKQRVLDAIAKRITVSSVRGTSLIKLSFESTSPEMSANFANTLADTYIHETLESRIQMASQAITWIHQRADTLKQQLAQDQARLQTFISTHHVVLMGKTAGKSPMSLTTQELVDLTTRKLEARAKLDTLEQTYGPLHPKVIAAKAELAKAEAALSRGKAQSRALGRTDVQLASLQDNVKSTSDLYQTFANRLKEAAQVSTLQTATARIIDPAVEPLSPIKPKKGKIIIAALLLSLVFGIGLIILSDRLNSTIISVDEVESRLGLPVLGLVPILSFETKNPDRNTVLEKMTSAENHQFIEAIHTIRTGIMLSAIDNPHKSILVTSSVPGEGKSTFASNLAIAMGNIGSVLLIDADLRKPSVSKYFNTNPATNGLSEYVSGTSELKDCLETSIKYGIDVMHAGIRPPDPLEFLSSKRFKTAMMNLEKKYDRIIVDSAPVQAVSDSLVLSNVVRGVVFVVKANATPDLLIKSCIKRLRQVEANIIGAVLSQVDTKRADIYGYGGYYDDYGYSKGDESFPKQDDKRPRSEPRLIAPADIENETEGIADESTIAEQFIVKEVYEDSAVEHALEDIDKENIESHEKA